MILPATAQRNPIAQWQLAALKDGVNELLSKAKLQGSLDGFGTPWCFAARRSARGLTVAAFELSRFPLTNDDKHMNMDRLAGALLYLVVFTGLGSCANLQPQDAGPAPDDDSNPLADYSVLASMPPSPETESPDTGKPEGAVEETAPAPDKSRLYPGNNRFVRQTGQTAVHRRLEGDGLLLNFENADLREVVRTILGDFLKVNYIYDPRVQGTVSLQTTKQLNAEQVLVTLETLLRMNGAALVDLGDDDYRVLPAAEAVGKVVPQLGGGESPLPLPPGFRVIVVPLRYVAVTEMEKLLEPFLTTKSLLRVDMERNLLLLAGSSQELAVLLETIRTFDVDWLAGMSIGLFTLDQVTPDEMMTELDAIFGTDANGPLAGLIRFQPVKRLNALLVISPQSAYLKKVGEWIRRLDRSSNAGQSLYVYYLQNGKAADVAKILQEVFSNRGSSARDDRLGRVAPGRRPVELASKDASGGKAAKKTTKRMLQPSAGRKSEGLSYAENSNIRIIADEVNNSLLILASPQDHKMVLAAIKKLDIVPLQVLIEATIAEVKLTNDMRFGLQWFFKSGDVSGTLSSGTKGGFDIASTYPGFSLVFAGADAKVILDALDKKTTVNIVSSPHLMVLDNQTASLQVGDEVPVITKQQQSTTADSNLVNTVEYKNTGVIMKVTPRVNSSGSIIMDVEQEVSTVVPSSDTAANLTPTISKREFKSSVVVQSGDTVVLGGLIFDLKTRRRDGLPLLSELPLIGPLFGSTNDEETRTELVMLITPRLVRNRYEAKQVTEEVRRRLRALKRLQRSTLPTPTWKREPPKRQLETTEKGVQ